MTRSPARITAPPMSVASTSLCRRTSRFNLRVSAALNCFLLFGIQGRGRRDGDVHHALGLILQRIKERRDLRKQGEPPVLREHEHELVPLRAQLAAADVDHEIGELFGSHARIAEQVLDPQILHDRGGGMQRVGPDRKKSARLRCGERSARVRSCDGRLVGHLYLRCELVDEIRMGARVDLALKQLRCRLHGELPDLVAQGFTCARRLERNLLLRGC